jgi:hypothetical protein
MSHEVDPMMLHDVLEAEIADDIMSEPEKKMEKICLQKKKLLSKPAILP